MRSNLMRLLAVATVLQHAGSESALMTGGARVGQLRGQRPMVAPRQQPLRRAQSSSDETAVVSDPRDAATLLRFKLSGSASEEWPELDGWQDDEGGEDAAAEDATALGVCEWAGVACTLEGRVMGLYFGWNTNGRGLDFRDPKTWVDGNVTILAELEALSHVNLMLTSVVGSVEPLAVLSELTYLNLGGTQVSGSISSLMSLQHLDYLNLRGTAVHGEPEDVASLYRLVDDLHLPEGSTSEGGVPPVPVPSNRTSAAGRASPSAGGGGAGGSGLSAAAWWRLGSGGWCWLLCSAALCIS
jgi:hypothetical protein